MLFRYTENLLETGHFDPRGSAGWCLANGVYRKQFLSVYPPSFRDNPLVPDLGGVSPGEWRPAVNHMR